MLDKTLETTKWVQLLKEKTTAATVFIVRCKLNQVMVILLTLGGGGGGGMFHSCVLLIPLDCI